MYHSIQIDEKNTWVDWGLVPSSRPVFAPPEQKKTLIDIPGANGTLDLSTALTGYPIYKNRSGTLEFIWYRQDRDWVDLLSEMNVYLNGVERYIMLEDDPTWYYEGTFSVNKWKSNNDGTGSRVSFDYNLKPYMKYYTNSVLYNPLQEGSVWNPFNKNNNIFAPQCRMMLPKDYNVIGISDKSKRSDLRANGEPIVPRIFVTFFSGNKIRILAHRTPTKQTLANVLDFQITGTQYDGYVNKNLILGGAGLYDELYIYGVNANGGYDASVSVAVDIAFQPGRL